MAEWRVSGGSHLVGERLADDRYRLRLLLIATVKVPPLQQR